MKIDYGISIGSDCPVSLLRETEEFSAVEIPGSMLAGKNFALPAALSRKKLFVRNNDERSFFRTVSDTNSGIRQDFYRLIQQKLDAAAQAGVSGVTITADMENLTVQEKLPENLRALLGVYCGMAEARRIPLLLEIRIPGKAAEMPEAYLQLKHALLYPYRTLCEIHPHEPGALEALEKFSAGCRFECSMFRVCFDAAAGNHLTAALFTRLQKLLRPVGSETPVMIFSPGNGADTAILSELARLIKTENAL